MNLLNEEDDQDLSFGENDGFGLRNGYDIGSFLANLVAGYGRSAPLYDSMAQQLSNRFSPSVTEPNLANIMKGIAYVESGGASNPYSLVGRETSRGDHALGKYQVMESNVGDWTREALGKRLTHQQFLSSPEAQERVASFRMNRMLNQGRSPEDIASIWFSGRPLSQAGNVHDAYGTTPSVYVRKMMHGMGL